MIPRSGGVVRYPHLTHGGYLGFAMSWAFMLSVVSTTAIEALVVVTYAAGYVRGWIGVDLTNTVGGVAVLTGPGIILAILLMGFFFLVNVFGVKFFGEFNRWASWWKTIIPILTFVLLFFAFNASNFTAYGASPRGGPTTSLTPYAVAAGVVYTLLQLAFLGALDWPAAGVEPGNWPALQGSDWANQPLYAALDPAGLALPGAFGVLLLIDAAISPAGTGWIYMGESSRVLYGISMHDDMPRAFQKISGRYRIRR